MEVDASGVSAQCLTCATYTHLINKWYALRDDPTMNKSYCYDVVESLQESLDKHQVEKWPSGWPMCRNYIPEKKPKHHIGNGKPKGLFAFTLTKSPSHALTVGDMLQAAHKVMSQKSCPVKKYAYYLEYKGFEEDGTPKHPHIHGIYETEKGGQIEDKHWKRAWDIWKTKDKDGKVITLGEGWIGGYHRPVIDDESYEDYIKKDGGLCKKYGFID